jgi:hypothetical protein
MICARACPRILLIGLKHAQHRDSPTPRSSGWAAAIDLNSVEIVNGKTGKKTLQVAALFSFIGGAADRLVAG